MLLDALSPVERALVGAPLVLWAGLLFGGLLLGHYDERQLYRAPRWARIGSSLALVAAACGWHALAQPRGAGGYSLPLALGMTAGLAGDLCMARLLPLRQPVLGGMACFGLGHVAYLAAQLRLAARQGLARPEPLWGAWVAWLAIGTLAWYLVVARGQRRRALHWAALPYSLLLASTTGVATGLALHAPALVPLALGATLFLISDLVLAAQIFRQLHFRSLGDLVWLTYGPGQMLIVYSVGAVILIVR